MPKTEEDVAGEGEVFVPKNPCLPEAKPTFGKKKLT
jgi:hypothetical protein